MRVFQRIALLPINFYAKRVSPALPDRCRYYPSCSTYAVQAIERFGVVRGLLLATWRVLRCNPLSNGGLDPVRIRRSNRATR